MQMEDTLIGRPAIRLVHVDAIAMQSRFDCLGDPDSLAHEYGPEIIAQPE